MNPVNNVVYSHRLLVVIIPMQLVVETGRVVDLGERLQGKWR